MEVVVVDAVERFAAGEVEGEVEALLSRTQTSHGRGQGNCARGRRDSGSSRELAGELSWQVKP